MNKKYKKMVLVLLSAHDKRFSVSHVQNFFSLSDVRKTLNLYLYLTDPLLKELSFARSTLLENPPTLAFQAGTAVMCHSPKTDDAVGIFFLLLGLKVLDFPF